MEIAMSLVAITPSCDSSGGRASQASRTARRWHVSSTASSGQSELLSHLDRSCAVGRAPWPCASTSSAFLTSRWGPLGPCGLVTGRCDPSGVN